MNPKQFLQIGGVILIVLAIVGFTGVTNDIEFFRLTQGENIAHLVLGVVAVAAAYMLTDATAQKWLVAAVGVLGIVTGLYGFVLPAGDLTNQNFFGLANLENPADNILHLVVGAWALYAAFGGQSRMVARPA